MFCCSPRPPPHHSQSYNWSPQDPANIEGAGEVDYQLPDGLLGKDFKYNLYGKGDEACNAVALRNPTLQASRRLLAPSSWQYAFKAIDFQSPKDALVAGSQEALDKWGAPARL